MGTHITVTPVSVGYIASSSLIPRPTPFFFCSSVCVLPLLCIILNANQRMKKNKKQVGLGTRLASNKNEIIFVLELLGSAKNIYPPSVHKSAEQLATITFGLRKQ